MTTTTESNTVNDLVNSVTEQGGRVYEVQNPNQPNEFGVIFPAEWSDERRGEFLRLATAAHGARYFQSRF